MNLFDLMAKISLDTSEFDEKMSESEGKGQSFGDSLKRGFATAGKIGAAAVGAVAVGTAALGKTLVNQTKELSSYGDHIDKTSQKMGISAQAYQEWDAILQHSGTSIDGMQRGMMTLTNKAVAGSEAFDALGISQESVASMSREDLFSAVITGLQGMEEGSERAALAQELLGTAAKELGPLLNTSAEDTQAMRDRVHELGGVMSDEAVKASAAYQDSLQDMNTSISGLKRGIVSEFLPGMTSVMDGLTSIFSGDSGSGTAQVTKGISDMLQKISEGMPKVMQIGGQILSGIGDAIMQNLPMLVEQGTQILINLTSGIVQSLPSLAQAGLTIISTLASSLSSSIPELIPVVIEAVMAIFNTLVENAPLLIEAAFSLMQGLINGIITAIPLILEQAPIIITELSTALMENLPLLIESGVGMINTITDALISMIPLLIEAAPTIITALLNALVENAPLLISSGVTLITTLFDAVIGAIPTLIAAAPELVQSLLTAVVENAPAMLSAGVEIMNSLIDGLASLVDSAITTVSDAVDEILNLFNFSWSLPELKTPHFSVGSGPTVLGVTLPTISIDWYKKAYEDPYLFDRPTVMATPGGLKGFGDGSGGEIVYGRDQLMRDIREAVGGVTINPQFKLYLDGDKLVGGTSERMDGSLGQMQVYQLRWEGV